MTAVTWSTLYGGDGTTTSDDADPVTGLDNYGYTERLVPAFANVVNVGAFCLVKAAAAAASEAAAAAWAASALNAPGTNATSTTSVAIANNVDKTFVIQTGKAYVIGQTLNAASAANPANYMAGQVKSYNSGTGSLVITVAQIGGSGTFADWVISMAAIVSSTLPSQSGNNGKFLTTNGTSASWAAAVIPSNNGSDFSNMATFRSNVGLSIGTHVQAYNANLAALAGLGLTADKVIFSTGAGALALQTLTGFARTVIEAPDAATMRSTLGVTIGTQVQGFSANLAALAGLGLTADKLIFATGPGAVALQTLTGFARTILDDPDAASVRNTIGAAAIGANNDITALNNMSTPLATTKGGTGQNFADLAALLAGLPVVGAAAGEGRLGSLYFKWGQASFTAQTAGNAGEATVTFTNAFPGGVAGIFLQQVQGGGAEGGTSFTPYVRSYSASQFIGGIDSTGTPNSVLSTFWIAFGY